MQKKIKHVKAGKCIASLSPRGDNSKTERWKTTRSQTTNSVSAKKQQQQNSTRQHQKHKMKSGYLDRVG